jgi:hypothetical protein
MPTQALAPDMTSCARRADDRNDPMETVFRPGSHVATSISCIAADPWAGGQDAYRIDGGGHNSRRGSSQRGRI